MDVDKFEKGYSYNIRHNYGKEGKRADYSPYNCMKIIMSNVGPDDIHGCPFKHSDLSNLKQKLLSWNISISSIGEVLEYVGRGHYQLACGKYFQFSHGINTAVGINHPNQYFTESQQVLGNKQNNTTEVGKPVPKKTTVEADAWGEDIDLENLNFDM